MSETEIKELRKDFKQWYTDFVMSGYTPSHDDHFNHFIKIIESDREKIQALTERLDFVDNLIKLGFEVLFFKSEDKIKIEILRNDLHVVSGFSIEEILKQLNP